MCYDRKRVIEDSISKMIGLGMRRSGLVFTLFLTSVLLNLVCSVQAENSPVSSVDASHRKKDVNADEKQDDQTISELLQGMATVVDSANNGESSVPANAQDAWIKIGTMVKNAFQAAYETYFTRLARASYSAEISNDCMGDLLQFIFALKDQKPWAVRMFDATSKVPAGFVEGTVSDLGHYDECLSVQNYDSEVKGQYCMIKVHPPLPPHTPGIASWSTIFNFTNTPLEGTVFEDFSAVAQAFYERSAIRGICVPSNCKEDDIRKLIDTIFRPSELMIKVDITYCEESKKHEISQFQKIVLGIFGGVILSTIIATIIYEVTKPTVANGTMVYNCFAKIIPECIRRFCSQLAITKNIEELFNTSTPEGTFACLNGIRVLTMSWIILSHTYFVMHLEMFSNSRRIASMVQELFFQGIVNAFIVVDTFFVISSMLVSYSSFKRLERTGGSINIPRMIILRIIRLGIPMMFLLLAIFVLPLIGSGPLWHEIVDTEMQKCKATWYGVIFFINNYLHFEDMCLIQTWFLGAELQMFLIFLPMLVLIYWWKPVGILVTSAIAIGGCFAAGILVYFKESYPTPILSATAKSDVADMIDNSYLPIYLHFAPYGVGFLLGYFLYENKKKFEIYPLLKLCGNIIAIASGLLVVLGTYNWNNGIPMTTTQSIIFASLHKLTWGLCVAWFIFLCSTGNGGYVDKILSWGFFVPLSRLNYMMYLWHFYVLWTRKGYIRERLYLSHYTMICEFVTNLVFSIILAFFAYLFFEAPFNGLSKEYLSDIFSRATWTVPKKGKEIAEENKS